MSKILTELKKYASPERKSVSESFFKSGEGEYGEGDLFIGVSVPDCRKVARLHAESSLKEMKKSLSSQIHEERLVALLVLVGQYAQAQKQKDSKSEKELAEFYLSYRHFVNNWDLVDTSAPYILGPFLYSHFERGEAEKFLKQLASSVSLWDRRIAMLATFYYLRQGDYGPTLKLAKILLKDREDLIHKAVGWLLREVGKKDEGELLSFLDQHASHMPRTALRYAIEKLHPKVKRQYMLKKL